MKQRKKSFGMRISAFVLSFAMVCTLLAGVNVVAFAADDNDLIVSVHCFYNDATKGGDGEHLYTKDLDEMSWLSSLPTWNDEDEAWKAPVSSSLAVYRVYNPNSGEHHYAAADEAEWLVSQGWTQEKIAFYSDDNMGVPVYRLWNGGEGVGSHYYTTDEGEAAYLASIGWTAEGVNFYGVKEEGEKEMTAVQTGANEITVTTESEFDGTEEFTITRGTIEEAVEDVDFDDNMKFAVITLDSNIRDAEYTVTCSDEEYDPASFEGEAPEVEALVFNGDELIATSNELQAGMVGVATLDQWGDPIDADLATANFSVAGGTFAKSGSAIQAGYKDNNDGTGMLTVLPLGDNFTLGSQVTVTAVYNDSTKVAQATLTVSATSVVSNMMVMDLMLNPEFGRYDDFVDERVTTTRISSTLPTGNVEDVAYVLPLMATDQYGNALNADALNVMLKSKSLYVTPTATYDPNTGTMTSTGAAQALPQFIDVPDMKGVVAVPITGDNTNYGTAVINFLSTGGFTTSKNVVVEQNEVIDTLTVTLDDLQLGKPVPVLLSAVDQYGDEVDLMTLYEKYPTNFAISDGGKTLTITDFNGGKSTIKTTGATFSVEDDIFCLTADKNTQKAGGVDVITVQSATSKVTLLQKKINAEATVASVRGLVPGTNTVLGGDYLATGINVGNSSKFVFVDSYGEVVDDATTLGNITYLPGNSAPANLPAGTYKYTVVNSKTANAVTEINKLGNGVISATTDADIYVTPVTETYKVTLYGNDATGKVTELSAKTFKVTRAGQIESYAAGFVNPLLNTFEKTSLYTGEASNVAGGDKAKLVVYGVDKGGNKFPISQGAGYNAASLQATKVGGAELALNNGLITVSNPNGDDDETGTAYVDVYATVDNKTKVVATASLECSDDAPTPLMFVGVKIDMSGGVFATAPKELVNVYTGLTIKTNAAVNVVGDLSDAPYNAEVKWSGVAFSDGTTVYAIAAMDQYGILSADSATVNGVSVPQNLSDGAILAVASGETTVKIPITVK